MTVSSNFGYSFLLKIGEGVNRFFTVIAAQSNIP